MATPVPAWKSGTTRPANAVSSLEPHAAPTPTDDAVAILGYRVSIPVVRDSQPAGKTPFHNDIPFPDGRGDSSRSIEWRNGCRQAEDRADRAQAADPSGGRRLTPHQPVGPDDHVTTG